MSFNLTKMMQGVPKEVQEYIAQRLERWIEKTVVDSVKAFATAAGVHQSYMDAIKIVRKGDFVYSIELDYFGPKGEPLGLWFELGTKEHIIRAKIADALRWIDKRTGKVRFAKWVRHPGTKPLNIMSNGAKFGMPRLQEKIIYETNLAMRQGKEPKIQ